ncbi:hypothetical protein [Pseudomonas sp. H9]|uniref:hypothetical protein n=1 Tax=Pseudomonas sp. H9 TaxID=483968 RepID=UPI001057A4BD|nr:hypothetical protein [Pseudomonas sp. H9]TDF85848.1 hypothetical protein E1573_02700 [Pseudomonas sp. H9]
MGDSQLHVTKPELYERLIDRLGLALEVAKTSVRLRDEVPAELELRGLSRAEFDVIKAYLDSLPEGRHGCSGAQLTEPSPSASVVWLKDKKRSTPTAKSRALQFK